MKSLTHDEVLKVLKAASQSKRNHAMILLALRHGMRASEVCGLRLSDLKDDTITIRRLKGSKTNIQQIQRHKGQPLLDEKTVLRTYLKERPQSPSAFVFLSQKGGALSRIQFFRVFRGISTEAGLPESKRHPHTLKHTAAVIMVDEGIDLARIQQALGHTEITSTAVYAKASDEQADAARAQAFQAAF